MEKSINRVVLVLRSSPNEVYTHKGGGFYSYTDVELIAYHLNKQCPNIEVICLWDKVEQPFKLRNVTVIPMIYKWPKWWAKMNIFAPDLEKYRPFLFIDLDTLVIGDLSEILPPLGDNVNKFITLGEFTEDKKLRLLNNIEPTLYSGIMWIPANNEKVTQIWERWIINIEGWMRTYAGDQDFIRTTVIHPDIWWQQITNKVGNFKPKEGERISGADGKVRWTENIRRNIDHFSIICLHGKPKMGSAAQYRVWVRDYIKECFDVPKKKVKVTIIIPYKKNPKRIWLQDAINSVPADCQLIVSEGSGMWAEQFNKVLDQVEGDYIKYLHDDDMLTPNCIEDSVKAIEEQGVDFIHGNAIELEVKTGKEYLCKSTDETSLSVLLQKNYIHSATTMYKREIFEKIGGFDETLTDSEEYEFNLRCLSSGFKLGYCDKFLAVYRRHEAQQTRILGGKQLMVTSKKIADKYRV